MAMSHGLVLRLEEFARATQGTNQEIEERNMNEWNSTDKLIMYWRKSVSHSVDTKMEFVILLRETLLHVFSPDWLKSPNGTLLVQAVKENYNRFPEIVKSRPQLHEVLERIFPDPWYNSFFPWNELFLGRLTVEDKCVQEFFHSEPEDIIIGRIHSFAKCGRYHEALSLAKQSFLYYYRVTRNAVFYSKPPSRDRNRYMHEKSHLGHASIDWIVLLWRKQKTLQFITKEILQFTCHEGVEIIGRMRENPKLKLFALECLQILLVRDITVPSKLCCTKKFFLLFCTMHKELNSSPKDFAASATSIVARLVPSSAHLYLFVEAAYEIYGVRYIDLYVDFYVRGLTADLNHLEIKKQEELHDEVESLEKHIVAVFEKLATLFMANNHLEAVRECLFSAYSLRPTKEHLNELIRLTQSLDSNSQKQLNFTSSNSSLFPVKTCSHGLKCDGSCSTANTIELTHPLLSKGIRNISYIVIQDLTTVLECKRHIRFHYNYYDWHLNIADLADYLKESDDSIARVKELTFDANNTDIERPELSVVSAKKEISSTNMECNIISPVAKRKSSEIPIDVGANVEVGSQVPNKRIKVFKMDPNTFSQAVTSTPSNMPPQNFQNAFEELIKQTLIGEKMPKGHSKVYSVHQERNQSPLDSNVNNTSSDNHARVSAYHLHEAEREYLSFATKTPHSSQSAVRYSSPAPIVRQSVVVAPTSKASDRTEHVQKNSRHSIQDIINSAIDDDKYFKTKIWKSSLPIKEENHLNLGRGNLEKSKHYQNYLAKASRFAPSDPLDSASNDSCNTPPPSKKPNHNLAQQLLPHCDRNSVIHHTTQHVNNNNTSAVSSQPSAASVGSSVQFRPKSSGTDLSAKLMQNDWLNSPLNPTFSKGSKFTSPRQEYLNQLHGTKASSQSHVSQSSHQQIKKPHFPLSELPHSVASTSLSTYSNLSQKAIERKPNVYSPEASRQLATAKVNAVQLPKPKPVSSVADQINQEWKKIKETRNLVPSSSYQASKSSSSHLYSSATTSSSLFTQTERQPSSSVSVKSLGDGKMVQSSVTEKSSDTSVSHQPWFSSPFPKSSSPASFADSSRSSPLVMSSSYHRQSPFLTALREKSRAAMSKNTPQNPKNSSLERFETAPTLPPKPSASSSPLLCDRLSQGSPSMQQRHTYSALDQVISRDSHGVLVFRAQNAIPATQYLGSTPQTQACCSPLETKPCESCSSGKKNDPEKDSNSSQALNLSQQALQEDLINYPARNQDLKISTMFDPNMSDCDPIVSCPYCSLELPKSLIMTHMENSHREKLKLQDYDFTEIKMPISFTQSVYSSSLRTPRTSILKPDVKALAVDNSVSFNTYYNWMETNPLTNLTREEKDSTLTQSFGADGNLFSATEFVKQESAIQLPNCASGIQTSDVPVRNGTPLVAGNSAASTMRGFDNIEKNENTSRSFSTLALEAPKLEVSLPSDTKKLNSMGNERNVISCSFCKEQFENPMLFEDHVKTCASGFRGGPSQTSENSNSTQMSRFCDTSQDIVGVKAEESKSGVNQRSTLSVSSTETSEKKSKHVSCPYCNKLLTIRYMRTHFHKKHKGVPFVKFKKSESVDHNNFLNPRVIKDEESSNAVLSPSWSAKYNPEVLVHSPLPNQSKEEVNSTNFAPPTGDKIKCHICFRTLTNESFLKKHLKNIHGVEGTSDIDHEETGKSELHNSSFSFNHQPSLEMSHVDNLQKELTPFSSINNPRDSSDPTLSNDNVRADSNSSLLEPHSAGNNPISKSVKSKLKEKVEKLHHCHLCPKAFANKINFDKHIELVHKLDNVSISIKEKSSGFSESTTNAIDHVQESPLSSKELLSPSNVDAKDTFSEAMKKSETHPLSSYSLFDVHKTDNLNTYSKMDCQTWKLKNDSISGSLAPVKRKDLPSNDEVMPSQSNYCDFSNLTSQTSKTESSAIVPYDQNKVAVYTGKKHIKKNRRASAEAHNQTSKDEFGAVVPFDPKKKKQAALYMRSTCDICTRTLSSPGNLTRHKKNVHHSVKAIKSEINKPLAESHISTSGLPSAEMVYDVNMLQNKNRIENNNPYPSLDQSGFISDPIPFPEDDHKMTNCETPVDMLPPIRDSSDDFDLILSELFKGREENAETLSNFALPYNAPEENRSLVHFESNYATQKECRALIPFEGNYSVQEGNRSILPLDGSYTALGENMSILPLEGNYTVLEENRSILPLEGNYAQEENNRSLLPLEGNYSAQEENIRSILPLEGNYTGQEENNGSLLPLEGNYSAQEESRRSILPLKGNYTGQEENNGSLLPLEGNYIAQEENSRCLFPMEGSYTAQKENNRSLLPLEEINRSTLSLEGSYNVLEKNDKAIFSYECNYTSRGENNRAVPFKENCIAQEFLERNYDFLGHQQEGNKDKEHEDLYKGRLEPEDWRSHANVSDNSLHDSMNSQTMQPCRVGDIDSVVNQSPENSVNCHYESLVNTNVNNELTEPEMGNNFVSPSQEHPPLSELDSASTLKSKKVQRKLSIIQEQVASLCQPDNSCRICPKKYSCRSALRLHIKSKHLNIKVIRKDKRTKLKGDTQCPSSVAIKNESEDFKSNQLQTEEGDDSLTYKQENVSVNAVVPVDTKNEKVETNLSTLAEQIASFCLPDNTCRVCQKIYSNKFTLQTHVKKIHLNIRESTPTSNIKKEEREKVGCPICGRMLAKGSVLRHIKKIHENETKKDTNLLSALNQDAQETPASTSDYNCNLLLPEKEQNSVSGTPFKDNLEQKPADDEIIKENMQKDTLIDPNIAESVTSKLIGNNIVSSTKTADNNQNVPSAEAGNVLNLLHENELQLNQKYSQINNAEGKGSNLLVELAESFVDSGHSMISTSPSILSGVQFSQPAPKFYPSSTDQSKLSSIEPISNKGASSVKDSSHPSRTESLTLHSVKAFEKSQSEHNVNTLEPKTLVLSHSLLVQKRSCKIESVGTHSCDGTLSNSDFAQDIPMTKLTEVANHVSKSLASNETGCKLEEKQVFNDGGHKIVLSVLEDVEANKFNVSNQNVEGTTSAENLKNHEDAFKKGNNSNVSSSPSCNSLEKVTQENSSKHKNIDDTSNDLSVSDNPKTFEHLQISDMAPCSESLAPKDKDVLLAGIDLDFPAEDPIKDVDENCDVSDPVGHKSNPSTKCRICPKTFKSMSALSRHLKSAHSVPLLKKVVISSLNLSENENKLSPPNLSLASTQEVNSSISDNFGGEVKESSVFALKTNLEKKGVTVEAVSETKSNESSSRTFLKSNKRSHSRKQSFSNLPSPVPVFLVDLVEDDGVSDEVNVSTPSKENDSSVTKMKNSSPSDNLPPLMRKKKFATTPPVEDLNKNVEVSESLEQDSISKSVDDCVQEKTAEESQHSLPKCIIKVCKDKENSNSVSYKITKTEQDSMPNARRCRKPALRKRIKEESFDSDDSVIILSDSVLSDHESPVRRNKRRRIPRKPYRDADYEKGALKFSARFSTLPKRTRLGRKPTLKPKKDLKASVAPEASCIQTFKRLIDIQRFLREHKQPCVRLSRIEDLVSNFDLKVLSYSLNDKLLKQIRASKKVTVSKGNKIDLCKTQGSLVSEKSSGYEISVKADKSVNSKFKFQESIRKPGNSKHKDTKKNENCCSCGMCMFCISSSPIKECYVILHKLPAKVF